MKDFVKGKGMLLLQCCFCLYRVEVIKVLKSLWKLYLRFRQPRPVPLSVSAWTSSHRNAARPPYICTDSFSPHPRSRAQRTISTVTDTIRSVCSINTSRFVNRDNHMKLGFLRKKTEQCFMSCFTHNLIRVIFWISIGSCLYRKCS